MALWRLMLSLILVPFVAFAAGRQDSRSHRHQSAGDANWSDLMASMDKMHAAMGSVERSGNDDADFVRLMLPHHQAAIDMAKAELTWGKEPQLRRLAQEIVTDQESEIQLMRLWLKQHDVPADTPHQADR
jgi:uncharacterized protein (DUF305 family)